MTIETESKLVSRCKCQRFSCESVVKKIDEVNYEYDFERRFQYIKDNDGVIYDGGFVDGCISQCQIRINKENGIVAPADMPIIRTKVTKPNIENKPKSQIQTDNNKISVEKISNLPKKKKKKSKDPYRNNSLRFCSSRG